MDTGERGFYCEIAAAGRFDCRAKRRVCRTVSDTWRAAARVHVTGSLKFDGATTDRGNHATTSLRRLAGFNYDDVIFLAGSTQAPEEALALQTFLALKDEHPRLKLVIVPRHPHRFEEVASLLMAAGLSTCSAHSSLARLPGVLAASCW